MKLGVEQTQYEHIMCINILWGSKTIINVLYAKHTCDNDVDSGDSAVDDWVPLRRLLRLKSMSVGILEQNDTIFHSSSLNKATYVRCQVMSAVTMS